MYNRMILAGNLTRDIEIKYTQSGSAIGNTGIASSRKFKSATGEQKEEVLFVDLTFFGRTAETANQYLRKGSKVLVEGRLKLDNWTAQDGTKRSKHSVTVESLQFLDNKPSDGTATQSNNIDDPNRHNASGHLNKPAGHTPPPNPIPENDINESEIPF